MTWLMPAVYHDSRWDVYSGVVSPASASCKQIVDRLTILARGVVVSIAFSQV